MANQNWMGSRRSTRLLRSSIMLLICLIFSWVDGSFFRGVRLARAAIPFVRLGTIEGVEISLFSRAIFTMWFILNESYFLSCISLWELLKITYFLSFSYWRSLLLSLGRAIILSLYTKLGTTHYLFSSFQSELLIIVSSWSWFIRMDKMAWNFFIYFYWCLIVSSSSYFSSSCSFCTSLSSARFTIYFFLISENLALISSTSSFRFL